jgi:hypothetical protein|tara:strand:+ start:212 stop:385 length:174 start_codon:yes stop_codon:yes gene_type:complete
VVLFVTYCFLYQLDFGDSYIRTSKNKAESPSVEEKQNFLDDQKKIELFFMSIEIDGN